MITTDAALELRCFGVRPLLGSLGLVVVISWGLSVGAPAYVTQQQQSRVRTTRTYVVITRPISETLPLAYYVRKLGMISYIRVKVPYSVQQKYGNSNCCEKSTDTESGVAYDSTGYNRVPVRIMLLTSLHAYYIIQLTFCKYVQTTNRRSACLGVRLRRAAACLQPTDITTSHSLSLVRLFPFFSQN